MMQKHFVTFESPGTFVFEETTKEIESWDTQIAIEMARVIVERYNATPFAFYFTTRSREENELDSRVVATSGRYFLGGQVLTIEELERENDPKNDILIRNMKGGDYKVVRNDNAWRVHLQMREHDVVLPFEAKGMPWPN